MSKLAVLRYTGSILLIIGYFILLNVSVFWGIAIRLFANLICLPWAIKHKIWDFVVLLTFFIVIEFDKFLKLILNN